MRSLALLAISAGFARSATTTPLAALSSRCEDGALIIDIPYKMDQKSSLLELTAGSCDADTPDGAVKFDHDLNTQAATVTVDIEKCGLAAALYDEPKSQAKSLYMATAYVAIGLRDETANLDYVYYSATLGTECGTKDLYTVEFEYGEIETPIPPGPTPVDPETCQKDKDGNCIIPAYTEYTLNFAEYTDKDYLVKATEETKQQLAGQPIYLQLSSPDLPDTMELAIQSCTVKRSDASTIGKLFDASSSCENDYIGLDVKLLGDKVQLSHKLFLFGSKTKSTFTLSCEVHVCDKAETGSKCDQIEAVCQPRICKCENGKALSHANCPADNADGCASCDDGFTLDGSKCVEDSKNEVCVETKTGVSTYDGCIDCENKVTVVFDSKFKQELIFEGPFELGETTKKCGNVPETAGKVASVSVQRTNNNGDGWRMQLFVDGEQWSHRSTNSWTEIKGDTDSCNVPNCCQEQDVCDLVRYGA